MKTRFLTLLLALALMMTGFCIAETAATESATQAGDPASLLPEGVAPVTWEVSADHLMIEGEEARALYERIVANDYPTMEA